MDRQVVMFIIGLIPIAIGGFLRINGNVEDGMAFMTAGLYLTIVWLIDSSFRLKKEVQKLRKEIDELKNNNF